MRIRCVRWWPIRIPLKGALATAAVPNLAQRQGLAVRVEFEAGAYGLGEAMPYPSSSFTGPESLLEAIRAYAAPMVGLEIEEARERISVVLGGRSGFQQRAICSALDTALWDAEARGANVRVAELLVTGSREWVAVNALIPAGDSEGASWGAARAREAGFGTVKMKVGGRPADEEYRRVRAVREVLGPKLRLRLDANGAWDRETAVETLRALEVFDLELVEQPVAADDLDGLAQVARSVAVPVAADEAVTSLESAERVLETGAVQILVVKPTVVGGISEGKRILDAARMAGVAAYVTTNLDAGVATAAALHLAATLPPDAPACGLATTGLLAHDLLSVNLRVESGDMALPEGPGLGVELDEEAVKLYQVGPEQST